MPSSSLSARLRATGIHLCLSALVAAAVSLLIFNWWYPAPFAAIAGVARIFLLLVFVDVVIGPALTAVVASPSKPRTELIRDLSVIVAIQLAALGYGIYSMALARPVALVFEVVEFRVVTAAELEPAGLNEAPAGLRELSWRGPKQMAAVKPTDLQEQLRVVELGLAGIPLAAIPRYWRDYTAYTGAVWSAARPVSALLAKYPSSIDVVEKFAMAAGKRASELRFVPLRARNAEWVTLISEPNAQIVGHLPLDGFF